MTVKSLYPTVLPSLNLDFANSKKLDPRVTFTRASVGTFVNENGLIATAASGAARFDHDPVTGKCLGLLVEEARTNLLTYSEQFDNAAWIKSSTTITANAATAPDGTLTADRLLETAATITFYTYLTSPALTAGTYTASVYAKGDGSGRLLNLTLNQSGTYRQAYFNLTTGVASNVDAALTASIQTLPNGWFRCSVTGTSSGNTTPFLFTAAAAGEDSVFVLRAGSASAGIYIWGAQLEAGSFPTSYIPTVASTVTRAADVASMTGTNFSSWWNSTASTFLVTGKVSSGRTQADNQGAGYLSTGQGSSRLLYVNLNEIATYDGTNKTWVYVSDQSQTHKMAVAFTTTNQYLVVDGGAAVTGAYNNLYNSASSIFIGKGVKELGGTIARIAYYPVRLPDAQLQALTAT
jgi:hypothetical protein